MNEDPAILQYEAWQSIINSPNWKYFRGLVEEHVNFLNKQTCIAVRSEKFNEAMKHQAKADDWIKVLSSADKRLKELGESIENSNE